MGHKRKRNRNTARAKTNAISNLKSWRLEAYFCLFSQFIELHHPAAKLLSLFSSLFTFRWLLSSSLNFILGHNNYFYMKSKFQRHLPDIRQTLMVIGSEYSTPPHFSR